MKNITGIIILAICFGSIIIGGITGGNIRLKEKELELKYPPVIQYDSTEYYKMKYNDCRTKWDALDSIVKVDVENELNKLN